MLENKSHKLHILYQNHAKELGAFARRRVGGEVAQDVVQDTYLRLLQYSSTGCLENPRAYLYRIAANVANDCGAAMKSQAEWLDIEADPETSTHTAPNTQVIVEARSQLARCLAALDELPPVYRHVFLLHRLDGMTQAEVAQALDIPKRTVERYIAKTLAHCLERVGR